MDSPLENLVGGGGGGGGGGLDVQKNPGKGKIKGKKFMHAK